MEKPNTKFTVVTSKRHRSHTRERPDASDNSDTNYETTYNEEKQKVANIIKVIDKFIAKLCRSFADNIIEATRNGHQYCYLFKYNDDPDRGELYNDTIEGLDTKYLLSGEWIPLAKQYVSHQKCKTIEYRLNNFIKDPKFNNGICPDTRLPYQVSVFHYKNEKSVFKNGVVVSRDGLKYS